MRVEEVPVAPPGDEEVVVEVRLLGLDAFIRTKMDGGAAFHGSTKIGEPLTAFGVGIVTARGASVKELEIGQRVTGVLMAQTVATVPAAKVKAARDGVSDAEHLHLLGLTTGLTAWAGVNCVSKRPEAGEVAVVSGAAGGVGSIAAQLCRAAGAKVIGVAGGERKVAFVRENLGVDGAVDYKRDIDTQLDELAPDGIDFFFDNAGGEILDAVLFRLRPGARVVICGGASQYNGNLGVGAVQGPKNYLKLAERGASMTGFVVTQFMGQLENGSKELLELQSQNKVRVHEHRMEGIESFPEALCTMFTGGHIGKMLVDLNTQPHPSL